MKQSIRDIIEGRKTIGIVEEEVKQKEAIKQIKPSLSFNKGSVFYVIQVLPRDEKRYKVGYTSSMVDRLNQHRTIAPDCVLIGKYPCHPYNEYLIIKRLKALKGVLPISDEVMDVNDNKLFLGYIKLMFKSVDMTKIQQDDEIFQQALCFQRNRVLSVNF